MRNLLCFILSVLLTLSTCSKGVRESLPSAGKDIEFDSGSNISFPVLNEKMVDNLDLLGKVWGFLKYYHPEIGKGNYNWDYELFRMLPAYLYVDNTKERDHIILDWIDKYGNVNDTKGRDNITIDWMGKFGNVLAKNISQPIQKNTFLTPDHEWIDNSDMSTDLKVALKNIYSNRHQGDHFYIGLFSGVQNPEFKNENQYSNMPYPDAGFRLLCLY